MEEIACGLDIVKACLEYITEAFAAINADGQGQKVQRKEEVLRQCMRFMEGSVSGAVVPTL